MEQLYRLWASNIRFGRRALRMTQDQLGRACGVSQQTIAKWEAAEQVPNDEQKLRLCAALSQEPRHVFPLVAVAVA